MPLSVLHFSHVLQRTAHDCGVACVAMAAQIPYERALSAFEARGLRTKHAGKPLSSNYVDVERVLADLGRASRRRRFSGTEHLPPLSIVKLSTGQSRHWHWAVALCDPVHGKALYDPGQWDVALERDPADPSSSAWLAQTSLIRGCLIDVLPI